MARSKRQTELNLEPTANDPRLFEINEQLDAIRDERQQAVNLHAELLNQLRPENVGRSGPTPDAPVEVGTATAQVLQTSLRAEISDAQRAIDAADEAKAVIEKRRSAILEQVGRDRANEMGPALHERAEAVATALVRLFEANSELDEFQRQLAAVGIPTTGPLQNVGAIRQCGDVAQLFRLPQSADLQATVENAYWPNLARAFPQTGVAKIAETRLRELNRG